MGKALSDRRRLPSAAVCGSPKSPTRQLGRRGAPVVFAGRLGSAAPSGLSAIPSVNQFVRSPISPTREGGQVVRFRQTNGYRWRIVGSGESGERFADQLLWRLAMSLHPQHPIPPVPDETARIARA